MLSKEYPTKEKLLAAHPDFLYASYSSAFSDKVAGTQDELQKEGIASYLSPFGCEKDSQRPATTFASVWGELTSVAKVFGVPERATAFEDQQKALQEQQNKEGEEAKENQAQAAEQQEGEAKDDGTPKDMETIEAILQNLEEKDKQEQKNARYRRSQVVIRGDWW